MKDVKTYGKNQSDPLEAASFLIDQLEGYEKQHGYKLHHLSCIQLHPGWMCCDPVRLVLKFLDSRGIEQREEKSPDAPHVRRFSHF